MMIVFINYQYNDLGANSLKYLNLSNDLSDWKTILDHSEESYIEGLTHLKIIFI